MRRLLKLPSACMTLTRVIADRVEASFGADAAATVVLHRALNIFHENPLADLPSGVTPRNRTQLADAACQSSSMSRGSLAARSFGISGAPAAHGHCGDPCLRKNRKARSASDSFRLDLV